MAELTSFHMETASTMPPPDAAILFASLDLGHAKKAASSSTTSGTSSGTAGQTVPGDKSWYSYWEKNNPQALALVWKDRVSDKTTYYENLKTNTPVYYSFDISLSGEADEKKLTAFSAAQKESAKKALAELTGATGVQFVETTDSNKVPGIVFALSSSLDPGDLGQQIFQTVNGAKQSTILLEKSTYGSSSLAPGSAGFETLLHELGHAAGLDDATGQEVEKKYPNMDDSKYTVMSYNNKGANGVGYNTTYAKLDKQALEALYPKNTNASSTTVMGDFEPVGSLSQDAASTSEETLFESLVSSAEEEFGISVDTDVLLDPILNALEDDGYAEAVEELASDPDMGFTTLMSVVEEDDEVVKDSYGATALLSGESGLAAWAPAGGLFDRAPFSTETSRASLAFGA